MGSSETNKSLNGRGWLEREDRLQAVLDRSPATVFFKDPRGR